MPNVSKLLFSPSIPFNLINDFSILYVTFYSTFIFKAGLVLAKHLKLKLTEGKFDGKQKK